jgi:hypothetical protein
MGARAVVVLQRIDGLIQRNGAALDDQCGTDHQQTILFNDIRPVDQDKWSAQVLAEMVANGSINNHAFGVQVAVGKQPVHALYIVFGQRRTIESTAQRGDGEKRAGQQGVDGGRQGSGALCVQRRD